MKIIIFLISFLIIATTAFGAYAFISEEAFVMKELENGLILEIDPVTEDIIGIEVTNKFLINTFELEESQINLSILHTIREEIGYGTKTYHRFRESELLDVIEPTLETEALNSRYALLVDAQNGRVLVDKKSTQKMYPASMTKIMTAIVAIELLEASEELNALVHLETEMFHYLYHQRASMAGFMPEERVPAIDLLYGIMLPSGGESTLAIARKVAGSEEAFVEKMNQKARELGLTQTNFTNPTGLHHPEHYTTLEEMVIILKYALTNEMFREIFTASTHTASTNLTMTSTLFRHLPRTTVKNGEILGGRTGFTPEAGRCLISLAVINGREYILATGGAENTPENQIQHLLDALYIYDQL